MNSKQREKRIFGIGEREEIALFWFNLKISIKGLNIIQSEEIDSIHRALTCSAAN